MNFKESIQRISFINEPYTRWKWREKRVSYGLENQDKIFFVIRRAECKVGLFSLVMTNMGLVKYALDRGYVPVIDMQTSQNTYLSPEEVGHLNSWEFYFDQPCGYTLEDVSVSKNIILSSGMITSKNIYPRAALINNQEEYNKWHPFFEKYLRINKDILQDADTIKKELFHGEKTLGVLCRGTDYTEQRPHNHPIQPKVEDMIIKAGQVMEMQDCKWIYLATEDESAYRKFKSFFGYRLKTTDARRCENIGRTNINDVIFEREKDRYLRGREYLINIICLAGCNCLVAGNAGGTYAALLMAEQYEYCYIYDLGVY